MTKTRTIVRRLVDWIGSRSFFRLVIGLLVVQAAWIALSGRYPMAFDEDFHLGIIRLYAHHLSPFWSSQPAGADMFGAVARDPSYIYQYLMSFPFRLISLFTHDLTIQVLWLRAIDISLFAWGISLYRRLLLKTGASAAIVHGALLVLVLIPVVPLLAAQINYDNLLLPLTAIVLLLCLKFNDGLKRKQFDLATLWQMIILGLLTSLVKYAFLPIFTVMIGFIVVRLWQNRGRLAPFQDRLKAGWKRISMPARLSLAVAAILALGLFGERYFVNLVKYHNPVPACDQVLTVRQCSSYGPWIRDYTDTLENVQPPPPHLKLTFTHAWLYGLWLRTFFAVDGPGSQFQTRGPLLLPGLGAIAFAIMGGLALLASLPIVFRQRHKPALWLLGAVSVVYLAALWQDEYKSFVQTGQPVAINGRYLLPVLPFIFLLVALSLTRLLRRWTEVKLAVLSLAVFCLLWGGGALTYILRSSETWYWPNPAMRHLNYDVQRLVGPITPGYTHKTQFLH